MFGLGYKWLRAFPLVKGRGEQRSSRGCRPPLGDGICLPCCGTRNFLFAFAHKISTTATSSPRFITHWVRFGSSPHSLRPEGRGRTNSILTTKRKQKTDRFLPIRFCLVAQLVNQPNRKLSKCS